MVTLNSRLLVDKDGSVYHPQSGKKIGGVTEIHADAYSTTLTIKFGNVEPETPNKATREEILEIMKQP